MDKLVADPNDIRVPNGVRAERHLQFRNGAEGLDGGIHVARISETGVKMLVLVVIRGVASDPRAVDWGNEGRQ